MRSSPVVLEILAHRFSAVVEEMAENIRRTSFSIFVKQTADFGTCLVTPDGEVFAAPRRISGNLMIGVPAREVIRSLAPYAPGDVGLSNDPDSTGGLVTHLPDLWAWQPLFVDGEIIAYALSFVHSSDIGGSVPSSIDWGHTDMHQEGLLIPPVRLLTAGDRNQAVFDLVARNSRVPAQNLGDLEAQVAGLRTAQRRLSEIADGYGKDAVKAAIADLVDTASARASALLDTLTPGTYSFVDYVEGVESFSPEGVRVTEVPPTRLSLALTVGDGRAHLDFDGTSPQVLEAINLHTGGEPGHYMLAFALVNWFYSQDKQIPYNSGLVRPLTAHLPPGSIVNPRAGAPCGVRAAVFFRIMDCVVGCLAQASAVAMAPGAGLVAIASISHVDLATGERKVSVGQPLTGGSGGRPGQRGLDGTSYMGGWLRNVPNEVLESDVPVLVEEYKYRRGSGGSGEQPGGDGLVVQVRSLEDDVTFVVRGLERLFYQPFGVNGGGPGASGLAVLNPGTSSERDLGRVGSITLRAGDVLRIETPGGGGLGSDAGSFDFGPARSSYETRFPQELQKRLVDAVLGRVPSARQASVYRALYLRIDRAAGSGAVTSGLVDEALDAAGLLDDLSRGEIA
ncbi:hydantoinase B/oxoprolinase family protein [Kineosporia succinea]|uniref:N-methylhydantoinase B n=1 Tax=Kineosporia succinea TaxID=84632 RepID=A0ABT9P2I8_9ACTN|nr:hydantoinase B/oxoprolinase family protein [Kineosporia succinea]MDP9826898.1 N-methylhydantoinase B [Kineosporia succinea]